MNTLIALGGLFLVSLIVACFAARFIGAGQERR